MKDDQVLSLRDLLNIVYRRIWVLKILVPVAPLLVFFACLVVTPTYESSAKVLITGKKESASLLAGVSVSGPAKIVNLNIDEMDLNSEMEILQSLDLWYKTAEALGPGFWEQTRVGMASQFTRSLSQGIAQLLAPVSSKEVEKKDPSEITRTRARSLLSGFNATPVAKSRAIDLTMRYSDPSQVQKILSVLLDQYIPYHAQVYSVPGVEAFFEEQLRQAKEAYETANQELTDYRKRWNLALPERQKTELISMMKAVEDSLLEVNSNLTQYQEMTTMLNQGAMPSGQLAPGMQRGGENTIINVAAVQLLQAEQKQFQLGEIFTAQSRDYRAAAQQFEDITAKFKSLLEGELTILKTKKSVLQSNRDSLIEQMRVLIEKSEEARYLQLQETVTKDQYLQLVAKTQEARFENLEDRQKLVDVKVLGKPLTPLSAAFPRTGLYVLTAFIFSIPLGLGIIFTMSFFDYTFASPVQLEKATGYQVLATLGLLKTREGMVGRPRGSRLFRALRKLKRPKKPKA